MIRSYCALLCFHYINVDYLKVVETDQQKHLRLTDGHTGCDSFLLGFLLAKCAWLTANVLDVKLLVLYLDGTRRHRKITCFKSRLVGTWGFARADPIFYCYQGNFENPLGTYLLTGCIGTS